MKKINIPILIMSLLLTATGTQAQQTYPIYVTPSLTPPYSLTLSDYSQIGSQRLVVTIHVRDVSLTNFPVRLHLKMENMNGVSIETIPTAPVTPIFLSGGEVSVLFGDDMKDCFNINNLQFKGYSKDEYRRTGQLPEGYYRFTVEVRHFATGRLISNQGRATAWIALGKPPMLKSPDNNAELGQIAGMPLTFSWIPSTVSVPTVSTQYTFEMWEMRIPGIQPAVVAASMPVFHSTTQMNTSLVVHPAELMLEPGMNYAWRVTASDVMGQVPFAQGGHSEVRSFIYQCRCDSITGFKVELKGQEVNYRWTPADNHTSFTIEMENPVSGWSKSEQVYNNKYNFKSDPDKTYRARVQAICKGNEMNPSEFSAWQTVNIPPLPKQEDICPECECRNSEPEPPITNFELRTDLQPGDTITTPSGTNIFIIKSVVPQGNGIYKGQFLYWVKIWGVKFLCDYWDLKVNTDNHIVDMNFESVFDPTFFLDVDAAQEYIDQLLDAGAILTTNMTIKDTVQVNASLEGAYINNLGQLVTISEDGTETVQPLPGKPDGTLVQGSNGEEYVLTSDGKIMGKDEFSNTGGNSRLMDNYNKEKEEKSQPSVNFYASPNQIYGFDSFDNNKPFKSNIPDEYPELKAGYRPAFKSVEAYKTDKVQVSDDTSILYKTEYGVPVTRSGNELTIRGGAGGDATILYAYSKQDTTEIIVGKLNILSWEVQTEKVCLVSVNGAKLPDIKTLEKALDEIYAPSITKWSISTGPSLTEITFENEQMTHGGSGTLTTYNADQKKIIDTLKKIHTPDKETSYLFFVDNVAGKEGVAGYMPIQYQYGFLYDNRNARNIAHELAHSVFNLPHTFAEKPFIAEQGATNNLMDYSSGSELWKHQWKLVQNPKNMLFKFLQDEEGAEIYTANEVKTLLEKIKNANAKSQVNLTTDMIVRLQDIIDDTNIIEEAGILGIDKNDFLSSFTHDEILELVEKLRNADADTDYNLPTDINSIVLANKVIVNIDEKKYKLTINGYAMTDKIYTTHIAEEVVANGHKLIFFNAVKIEKNEKSANTTNTDPTDVKNIRKAFEIIVHDENAYGTVEDLKTHLKIKGTFDLSGTPTVTNNGITLRLKRKYSNSKITIGELSVEGDPSVKLLTVELKGGTNEEAKENCITTKDQKYCPTCKDLTCFRINEGTYNFELNKKEDTPQPQHRYKSLRLRTLNTETGGKRDGILIHTGWNYGFTEGCILTMSYNDVQKIVDNPENHLKFISGKIKEIVMYGFEFDGKTKITFENAQSEIQENTSIAFSGFSDESYNATFTIIEKIDDKNIVIDHTFNKNAKMNNARFISNVGIGVKGINYDNSAPTTMSLYEYVEKYVPSGIVKGKIVITNEPVETLPETTKEQLNVFGNWSDWTHWLQGDN